MASFSNGCGLWLSLAPACTFDPANEATGGLQGEPADQPMPLRGGCSGGSGGDVLAAAAVMFWRARAATREALAGRARAVAQVGALLRPSETRDRP